MRRCPRCNRVYTEDDLNFCLDDGELLQQFSDEQPTRPLNQTDPPPTIVMDSPRVTNPIGWDARQPIGGQVGQWQGQTSASPQTYYAPSAMMRSPSQTLALVSLIIGASSLVLGWCCSNGLVTGPAAIIIGVIALVQIKNYPHLYGGKGLALGGIAMGGFFVVLYLLFILIYGLAAIGGVLGR